MEVLRLWRNRSVLAFCDPDTPNLGYFVDFYKIPPHVLLMAKILVHSEKF